MSTSHPVSAEQLQARIKAARKTKPRPSTSAATPSGISSASVHIINCDQTSHNNSLSGSRRSRRPLRIEALSKDPNGCYTLPPPTPNRSSSCQTAAPLTFPSKKKSPLSMVISLEAIPELPSQPASVTMSSFTSPTGSITLKKNISDRVPRTAFQHIIGTSKWVSHKSRLCASGIHHAWK